ncbi:SR-related and CTD-associated factor 8-like, partial [Pollicipes pollicipes]|uniref:SR-related and CTD-associated factor 8-like n=1 Tax=Pollicipes pollicipes TaxID=41117 RepID=UPI00188595A7
MDLVKVFNAELTSLYDQKPPISKVKMTSLTKGAIRAIKFYKHAVQSVEKFLQKCRTEYKIPGLYVIDSIVRQSRHQFGVDRDVFAPRFAKNLSVTFYHIFKCPPEDKSKVIRVLNLWQKNQVFPPEVIQPIFDLADPESATSREIEQQLLAKEQQPTPAAPPSTAAGAAAGPPGDGPAPAGRQAEGAPATAQVDPGLIQKLHQLQTLLAQPTATPEQAAPKFNQRLLDDFDYDEEPDGTPKPVEPSLESLGTLLSNPDVLKQLQGLQQTLQAQKQQEQSERDRKFRLQENEFDKQLAQTVGSLPFASEIELKPPSASELAMMSAMSAPLAATGDRDMRLELAPELAVPPPRRPASPLEEGERGPDTDNDDRARDRDERERESERERERERKKRGLPALKPDHLGVCSTTLWVGHLSKLVHQEDLSDLFGEYGDVLSIDLIPPRGCAFICMNRRQDAARALLKLKNHKLQGKPITIAWAPGKGMKGKDFKDYWEVEAGCSYIPHGRLTVMSDLDAMEEGGMIDDQSVPDWLKGRYQQLHQMDQLPVSAVPVLGDPMQQLAMPAPAGAGTAPFVTLPTSLPPQQQLMAPSEPAGQAMQPMMASVPPPVSVALNLAFGGARPPGLMSLPPMGLPPPALLPTASSVLGQPLLSAPPGAAQPLQPGQLMTSQAGMADQTAAAESADDVTGGTGAAAKPADDITAWHGRAGTTAESTDDVTARHDGTRVSAESADDVTARDASAGSSAEPADDVTAGDVSTGSSAKSADDVTARDDHAGFAAKSANGFTADDFFRRCSLLAVGAAAADHVDAVGASASHHVGAVGPAAAGPGLAAGGAAGRRPAAGRAAGAAAVGLHHRRADGYRLGRGAAGQRPAGAGRARHRPTGGNAAATEGQSVGRRSGERRRQQGRRQEGRCGGAAPLPDGAPHQLGQHQRQRAATARARPGARARARQGPRARPR